MADVYANCYAAPIAYAITVPLIIASQESFSIDLLVGIFTTVFGVIPFGRIFVVKGTVCTTARLDS